MLGVATKLFMLTELEPRCNGFWLMRPLDCEEKIEQVCYLSKDNKPARSFICKLSY